MSPIDFPDLLEDRGGEESRGRRQSSHGRLITSTLRSRSRSRSRARVQRRSASCQPTERTASAEAKLAEKKKRRSLSKPPSKESASRSLSRPSRAISKEEKKAAKAAKKAEEKERSKSKTRSPSPSKRRSTLKTSNQESKSSSKKNSKEWSADIINLVDKTEEDILLGQIMSGNNPVINPTTGSSLKKKSSSETSKSDSNIRARSRSKTRKQTTSSSSNVKTKDASPSKKEKYAATSSPSSSSNDTGSPKSVVRFPNNSSHGKATYSDEELSESDEETTLSDEEEEEESNSVATNDLLDQVKSRMEQQRLMEEVKDLRRVIEKKDAEIEQLTGQLRMAISTKCDLVIAHTELERLHEMDLKQRDLYAEDMKRSNLALVEMRAEVEKEFMNELNNLSSEVREAEAKRVQEVAEKDEIIRLMEEKVRRLELKAMGGVSARRDGDSKVQYYKKKLGVYDQ